MITSLLWLFLAATARVVCGQATGDGRRYSARVGVIVGPGDEALEEVLRYTLESSRKSSSLLHLDPGLDLELVVERTDWADTFQISRGVCRILDAGVVALVAGAGHHEAYRSLASYSTTFRLPWIVPYSAGQGSVAPLKFGVVLQPDLLTPLSSLVSFLNYQSILYLYDSEAGPSRLLSVLRESGAQLIAAIRVSSSTHALAHLRQVMSSKNATLMPVVLDTELNIAEELLSELSVQPYQLQRRFQFLLARPVNKEEFWRPEFLRLNVTALRWLNSTRPTYADFRFKWRHLSRLPLDEKVLLSYDAARVLSRGLRRLIESEDASRLHALPDGRLPGTGGTDCLRTPILPWTEGEIVASYFQKATLKNGVTEEVKFNPKGRRTGYKVDIVATTPLQHVKVGEWTTAGGLKMDIPAPLPIQMEEPTISSSLRGQTLRVTTTLTPPYMMSKDEGRSNFEGYCKDLLDALSSKLGFKYKIHVTPDGRYGTPDRQGRWNGMIGEIINGEADMSMAPLTITASRQRVVDFSTPFMHASIGLLLKKAEPISELGPFFFLHGFSASVWVGAAAAYVIMGAALYASLRFTSPAPTRLPPDDSGAEPAAPSVCGSFWFVLGTGLFQSTGIHPKSIASRLAGTVWWLFSLALGAMYLASLVAVLMGHRIEDSQTAALHTMTATEIMDQFVKTGTPKIGVLEAGSTEAYFKKSRLSPYREYGQMLGSHPDLGIATYSQGIAKVRESDGDFAMLMESPALSYTNGKMCDTTQPRENFPHSFSFGVAMRNGSSFTRAISEAIIMMQESGALTELYTKWWTSECSSSGQRAFSELYSGSLTLSDVSGLFYLLIAGLGLVLVVTLVEIFIKKKHGQSNEVPMK